MTLPRTTFSILPLGFSLVFAGSLSAQVITDFLPKYGSPGDKVTIIGSGFNSGTTVRFWNGVVATGRSVTTGSTISVTNVPAGIFTGPISVQNGSGPVNYSADLFTVVGPGPFIERVEPNYGRVNDDFIIYGAHFIPGSVVRIGNVTAASIPNADGSILTAFVPSGAVTAPVSVSASGFSYTNAEPFTVVGVGPYIAHFTPTAGSDTTPVLLFGLNFTSGSTVRFNGAVAPSDPVVNAEQIQAYAPLGVTTGLISVTTPQGSHTNSTLFYGPIRLTGFSPSSAGVGAQVTITGTNFTGTTAVKFGGFTGTSASFVVSNNNLLVATVPTNASTGVLVISTPAGSLPTTSNFVVRPNITGFTPPAGAAGTPVLITGTRLIDNSATAPTVTFNGTNATVTSFSADQVIATAPASSTGFITLTTTDGTSTSAAPFYYPPRITGFSTNSAPPGSQVSVFGQSLTNTSAVLFNGVPAAFSVSNNTLLSATVPPGFTTGPITVTAPGGTANSSPLLYYAAPTISAFTPDSGSAGTSVTIFGTSLQGTTAVRFNGTNASFSNVTGTQLTAIVPSGASTGPITVTAPAGTATSAESFVVPLSADIRVNTFLHVPEPAYVTEQLTLTIVPSNDGPNTSSNVTASVTLSPLVQFKSAATQKGTINTNGNPIVFNLGPLTRFDNPTLTVVVVPRAPGTATNSVTFTSTTADPNSGNNTLARVTTVLPQPELQITGLATNLVRVSWPVAASNFTLQSTPLLTNTPPWSNVTSPPVIEGDERVVTEGRTGEAKYYRLKK